MTGSAVVDGLLVVVGLALLVAGGEALVGGATGLARRARLPEGVIGLTIVAAGTSMPELVVSLQAAWVGSAGMAVGNVVGSNLFNIGAVIGLTALLRPLRISASTARIEWPVMTLAALAGAAMAWDGTVGRWEGGALVAALVAFTAWAIRQGDGDDGDPSEPLPPFGRAAGAVALGVALLAVGSTVLVEGAVGLAAGLGVSDTLIGLTLVAAGTSTPELVTSLVAARRGQDDIAVGNVVGSNLFNVLGILGLTAVVLPLAVPPDVVARDVPWMLLASFALLPAMVTGRVGRPLAGALLLGFGVYLGLATGLLPALGS